MPGPEEDTRAEVSDPDDPGWDAECEYCECRMSWSDDEGGNDTTGTYREADTWGFWHRRECEPSIRLLSPADLDAERATMERLRRRYPEMYGSPEDEREPREEQDADGDHE